MVIRYQGEGEMGSSWGIPKPSFWTSLSWVPGLLPAPHTPHPTPCLRVEWGSVRAESLDPLRLLSTRKRKGSALLGDPSVGFVMAAQAWSKTRLSPRLNVTPGKF